MGEKGGGEVVFERCSCVLSRCLDIILLVHSMFIP